ncbi:MAG: GIY-YIG nuclease family protein [Marinosulfonomonas sp.]
MAETTGSVHDSLARRVAPFPFPQRNYQSFTLLIAFTFRMGQHQYMPILLQDIWPIENLGEYKIHFARWNQLSQPLEVFARNRREWQEWQEYRPGRDDFNRPLIFSLIQFYHEQDTWLFGGVYRVLERHADRYEVELTEIGANMIGRLKLFYPYRDRTTRAVMERHHATFEVREILSEPYSGRTFPGFDDVDLSFEELETLIRNERPDWRAAMENVKGVYLITDTHTGRRYVGSAYADLGIWSRWRQYIETGHGGNVELTRLVRDEGLAYCREHFRFALLEQRTARTPDEIVTARETFWKRVLLTRGEQGMNRN